MNSFISSFCFEYTAPTTTIANTNRATPVMKTNLFMVENNATHMIPITMVIHTAFFERTFATTAAVVVIFSPVFMIYVFKK